MFCDYEAIAIWYEEAIKALKERSTHFFKRMPNFLRSLNILVNLPEGQRKNSDLC